MTSIEDSIFGTTGIPENYDRLDRIEEIANKSYTMHDELVGLGYEYITNYADLFIYKVPEDSNKRYIMEQEDDLLRLYRTYNKYGEK